MPLNDLKKMQSKWNKNFALNIKPCKGQISGTSEFLMHEYARKSMVIGEKIHVQISKENCSLRVEIGQFY